MRLGLAFLGLGTGGGGGEGLLALGVALEEGLDERLKEGGT